ncbi:hypothetical protein BsWGS_19221 [Bradybaena similaris]
MHSGRLQINKWMVCGAVLVILLLAILSVRAEDVEEEGCGNGCHNVDPDPSQMSRCVRYACRRRVFRYFIRFGKRGDVNPAQPDLQTRFPNDDTGSSHQLLQQHDDKNTHKRKPLVQTPEAAQRQLLQNRRQQKLVEMLLRFG